MSIVRHRRCAALRGQEGKAPTSTSSGLAADGLGRLRRPFGAPGVRAIYVRGVNARVGSRPRSLDGQTDADPGQGCCGDGGRVWLRQPDKRGREVRRVTTRCCSTQGSASRLRLGRTSSVRRPCPNVICLSHSRAYIRRSRAVAGNPSRPQCCVSSEAGGCQKVVRYGPVRPLGVPEVYLGPFLTAFGDDRRAGDRRKEELRCRGT